jgi:hypothetical protein
MFLEFLQQRDVTERKMFEKEMIDAKFLQKLLQSQTTVLSNMTTRFAHQNHFRVYKCVIENRIRFTKISRSYKYKRQVFKSAYK